MKEYLQPIQNFLKAISPRNIRSMVDFAEQELILSTGVRKGERFNYSFAPYTKLIIDGIESKKYKRVFTSGCVQSGKTITTTVLPILYYLFEIGEDVIMMTPSIEMCQSIYTDKILPVIMMNEKLKKFIPDTAQGSRAGKNATILRFTNGSSLRFFGSGGGDGQRSSHTARIVVASELDKFDSSSESSDETDPIRQLEARTASYGSRAKFIGECTVSGEAGRMNQEFISGTGTRVFVKCPYCNIHIYPEREQFKGWETDDIISAMNSAYYECQLCFNKWSEQDRKKALQEPRLVHRGQIINDKNEIEGEEPKTDTFAVKYNAMISPLLTMADIGAKEWRAKQSDTVDARKEMTQFVWSEPYEDETLTVANLDQHRLMANFGKHSFGDLVPLGDFTIAAVDVQREWIWILVERWSHDLTSWVMYFNSVPILEKDRQHQDINISPDEIVSALNRAKDIASNYKAESMFIDISYKHSDSSTHVIRNWVNGNAGVHGVMGRSESMFSRMSGKRQSLRLSGVENDAIQLRVQDNGERITFINTDVIKDELYARLQRPLGQAGCKYLPQDTLPQYGYYLKHLTGERRTIKTLNNGTEKREWKKMSSRHNDLFDCSVYSLAAAMLRRTVVKPLVHAEETRKNTPTVVARQRPRSGGSGGGF